MFTLPTINNPVRLMALFGKLAPWLAAFLFGAVAAWYLTHNYYAAKVANLGRDIAMMRQDKSERARTLEHDINKATSLVDVLHTESRIKTESIVTSQKERVQTYATHGVPFALPDDWVQLDAQHALELSQD